ncbi:aminomethyl-transferring glycine dehydrogenase subunit GcvPB [bacterium]|nr:aminomethyl-transferring glycine dehydrogenase subunit GcvPB [candidate division CSSED10-310 bacterium]
MNCKDPFPGIKGLIFDEPLIFNRSESGRNGCSVPDDDLVDFTYSIPDTFLLRDDIPGMPEVCELDMVRHYTRLSQWNYSVDLGMYPLGSCTMKYNPKVNEEIASLDGFAQLHPHTPIHLSQGALQVMYDLARYLTEISGLSAVTLQPSAGAQGELAGMLIIKSFHVNNGDSQRVNVLIPDSAHGTNPASCVLAGLKAVEIKSGPDGRLDPEAIVPYLNESLAGIMMTNPNTLGIFETHADKVADMIHGAGGLVYMDGANLNALMGIVKPADLGVDVQHINLHKTFSTPHGGGGPGSGPVAVSEKLKPFLPIPIIEFDGERYMYQWDRPLSIGRLHGFMGNFAVMLRAYAYIRALGPDGIRSVSEAAILNANYIKEKLRPYYNLPYNDICKHECVLNDEYQAKNSITTMDIAKRLMDYGFHPPTVYFPLIVHGAIMIEPTESESRRNLDQFINAMIRIAQEAEENPDLLKSAPHLPKLTRLDETLAARKLILRWTPDA